MFSFIKKLKIYPYKYVPKCPNCGSYCTGRYMKEPMTRSDIEYIELESLKNGEIVRFSPREPIENAFCVDCGHRWGKMITTRFLTKEELEEQVQLRGTERAYNELKQELEQKELFGGKRKKRII